MASNRQSLSKSGLYYLLYNVLNVAFPFVTGIYVARVLLPESIGEVTAAQNLAQYFVILSFLGIPTYGLREIAKTRNNRGDRNQVFSELFVINLISTITFSVIYLALVLSVPQYRASLPLYLVTGVSIVLNALNISWLFEGLEEFRFISVRNLAFKAISFAALLIFVRRPEDYLAYALITVLGTAGNYLVNMAVSPRFAKIRFRGLNLKRHLKSILFLVAVNLAIELYSLMDVTMMNFLSGKDSIAFYKYGHNIEKILLQIVNTFTMVLIPRITYCHNSGDRDEFNRLVSKAMKLIVITSVPMIVGILFTADFLIVKMYGEAYLSSAMVLKLFSVLLLVSPTGYLLGSRMLLVTDQEHKMLISVGLGAVVNLIGNFMLIPRFQEYGATWASIISELVVMAVYVFLGKKYFKLSGVLKTSLKVLVSAGIMFIYLFGIRFLPLNGWIVLALEIVGAAVLYILALVLLKESVTQEYLNVVGQKLKRLRKSK